MFATMCCCIFQYFSVSNYTGFKVGTFCIKQASNRQVAYGVVLTADGEFILRFDLCYTAVYTVVDFHFSVNNKPLQTKTCAIFFTNVRPCRASFLSC